jgi:hypothetical protein
LDEKRALVGVEISTATPVMAAADGLPAWFCRCPDTISHLENTLPRLRDNAENTYYLFWAHGQFFSIIV